MDENAVASFGLGNETNRSGILVAGSHVLMPRYAFWSLEPRTTWFGGSLIESGAIKLLREDADAQETSDDPHPDRCGLGVPH